MCMYAAIENKIMTFWSCKIHLSLSYKMKNSKEEALKTFDTFTVPFILTPVSQL